MRRRGFDEIFDVVVVGYGYAGGAAAISAAEAGASVLLLEKMPTPGGISICSAGGVRIAREVGPALAYLRATNAGKTPDPVLAALARGMVELPDQIQALAACHGARVAVRRSPANYPFEGFETFGFVYVEDVPGFDAEAAYPHVRGSPAGAMLFKVVEDEVASRPIEVRLDQRVTALVKDAEGRVSGVEIAGSKAVGARGGVILACGGFEADPAMQDQYWPGGAALNAAFRGNTGDGIRMAQAAGADLWHMWHYHGSYGFAPPRPGHPFGIRVKRLPDWTPGDARELPAMAWILLDRDGRRFMNEYEPYVQDTGARPLGALDPSRQTMPRNPAHLVVDSSGLALYPLGKPTSNDAVARYDWSHDNEAEVAAGLVRRAADVAELAAMIGAPTATVQKSLERWNRQCADGRDDDFARPPVSMVRVATPPYYVAEVWQIVSNTQGGPVHDAEQRVLDPYGQPIPGLFAAGELGSAFGHLYMSGGNLAECFIGGRTAGLGAAAAARNANVETRAAVHG
jgi:succinate dehydrogenase/fumarate reductase flavoprotein subunit